MHTSFQREDDEHIFVEHDQNNKTKHILYNIEINFNLKFLLDIFFNSLLDFC